MRRRWTLAVTTTAAAAITIGLSLPAQATAPTARAASSPTVGHAGTDGQRQAALAGSAAYTPPALHWGTCDDGTLQSFGAECAMLTVPLDYAQPWGRKIQLAVSRVKSDPTAGKRQGVMLVNPGGPGGSGLVFSIFGAFVPNNAGRLYDWIGFDPRGVGDSVPSLSCDGDYFPYNRPDYVPTTAALEKTWLTKAAGYSAACDKAGGALLEHTDSVTWAMDMESIRKALGEQQINYYGFSYGTYLGQVYSSMYPGRVRRMVWDGVVDPTRVWYAANLDQDAAFQITEDKYFDWVATYDSVYHLGSTGYAVKGLWQKILDQVRSKPAAGGRIGPDEWTDAFLSAGYYVYGWADLAQAFSAAVNQHDWSGIVAAYDGANGAGPGSDNTYANYLAVQCTDVQWPTAWSTWRTDNWRMYGRAPFETWANAWYNAPCLTWGAKAGTPLPITGTSAPILLIAEQYDAATPYSGALEVRSLYPNSRLIEGVRGTTHAGSLSGVACTDNTIAHYLRTGALPDRVSGNVADKKCPPVPAPDPTASGATARAATPAMPKVLRDALVAAQLHR